RYYNLRSRDRAPVLHRLSGAQAYESTMLRISWLASHFIELLGTRRLQPQLLMIMLAMLLVPLLLVRPLPEVLPLPPLNLDEVLFASIWLIGCVCAISAAWLAKYHRLAALVLIGGTGAITSITFLWLSAPDLA